MKTPLTLPDLGLGERVVTASVWLIDVGSAVVEGDLLLEVLSDSVTVDLPAPASGTLVKTLVAEDDELHVGQTLGLIEGAQPEPS